MRIEAGRTRIELPPTVDKVTAVSIRRRSVDNFEVILKLVDSIVTPDPVPSTPSCYAIMLRDGKRTLVLDPPPSRGYYLRIRYSPHEREL